jgi:hypothetical protein
MIAGDARGRDQVCRSIAGLDEVDHGERQVARIGGE